MDEYVDLCCSFGVPVWIATLIHNAKHLKSDCARRRKFYKLLHKKLILHKVGLNEGSVLPPTYVYPDQVKQLIRSVFPLGICNYPNPSHDRVVNVTAEDLHKVKNN